MKEWLRRHPFPRAVVGALRRHLLECVAVVCLIGLVVVVDPVRLARILGRIRPATALLMLPTVLAVYAFRGLGWWVALRHLGLRISAFRATYIMVAGQTMIFMPTGDLARVAMVERTGASGVDSGAIAGSITFQELLFMGVLGLGVLPRVVLHPDIALLVVAMTAAHVGIFTVLLWEPAYRRAVRAVERIRPLRRFDRQLRSLRPAFVRLMRPQDLVLVIFFNALAAASMYLLFHLALIAVGVERISLAQSSFAYGLAHLLSGLSLLPGGVGSMEAIVTATLAGQGVPAYRGAAAAILFRGYNDLLMALIGVVAGLLVRRESHHAGEESDRHRPTSHAFEREAAEGRKEN